MNNWALYVLTVLIWGSTWLAIEYQLGVVAPEVSVFYRYVLSALLLFAWCAARDRNLRFPASAHFRFVLLGLLLFGLNYIIAYHAQRFISSALMAIAFSTLLWMNMINARVIFGTRSSPKTIVGALLGVAGIGVMFSPSIGELSLKDATVIGAGLSLVSAYCASLGNMASQSAQKAGLPVVQSNAWGMFYGAMITGVIALAEGHEFNFDTSVGYVGSLAYLVVFGSIIAFGAYLTLLGRIGANKAGYAMVLFPVVALVLSILFEDLKITLPMMIGVTLVLSGNFLVMRPEKKILGEPAPV